VSSGPEEEAAFDVSMLEQGVPIELIGRSGQLVRGPGWGHPEANPLRDLQEFARFAEIQYLLSDDLGEET
jgi:hypothetical protein